MHRTGIYLTVQQIAEIKKVSVQSVHKMLNKNNFYHRTIKGSGRPRKEYRLEDLPIEIRNAYLNIYGAALNQKADDMAGKNEGSQGGDLGGDQAGENEGGQAVDENKNLPVPVSICDLVTLPHEGKISDPWYDMPQVCRKRGIELLGIVNQAREIFWKAKSGKVKRLEKYATKKGISYPSLRRYMKAADDAVANAEITGDDPMYSQIKALTPKWGRNKNQARAFDDDALAFACAKYLSQKRLNMMDIFNETKGVAEVNGWKTGSYDSMLRAFKKIDGGTKKLARLGKHRFEADHQFKVLRDYTEIPPNFMWCGDHHIFDVFVKIPDGKGGWLFKRPWLTAWMDMRTRSFMGWVVSFKPNSYGIAMALAHGILDKGDPDFPQHGLPESVYIDNGKDYRSKYLTGETVEIGKIDYPDIIQEYAALGIDPFYIDLEYDPEEETWVKKRGQKNIVIKSVKVGGVFASLNVRTRFAICYHPWSKPIERAFRNVVQGFSRQLPGWCGSGHEQRPDKLKFELKGANVLTFDEFNRSWYDWVTTKYHKTSHRGHGMDGMSPDQAFTSLCPEPKKCEPNLLDFALMKKDRVKIHSWGFRLNTRDFVFDLPVDITGGYIANKLIGSYASIYYDYDYKMVRIYQDGRWICNAQPLQRASFINDDDPVMTDGLRMQSYQKKAADAIMDKIREHSSNASGGVDAEQQRLFDYMEAHAAQQTSALPAVKSSPGHEHEPSISEDEKKTIQAELEELKALNEPENKPEPVKEEQIKLESSPLIFEELPEMEEMARYEKLIEIEAKNWMIPKKFKDFMRYYEMTPVYRKNIDYFDKLRTTAVLKQMKSADEYKEAGRDGSPGQ